MVVFRILSHHLSDNHGEVEKLVNLASRHCVVMIPFGGGTSVSGALLCPEEESRMIVSLDTSQMVSQV